MTREKYVAPSIAETAFNCPHCGALATQTWFKLYAEPVERSERLPIRLVGQDVDEEKLDQIEDLDERQKLREWVKQMVTGAPFVEVRSKSAYPSWDLFNLNVARCYNCTRVSAWIGNNLAWPVIGDAPPANPDLPDDVRLDYDEAGRILNLSPRGAAALLRLAIQKLCKELGGKGKKIDDDIAELVRNGLDARIQRALDIVRVIGNNAVHPGQVDLRDDRATAEKLFGLINVIADRMISQPKGIDALYEGLPESSLKAIERRDGKHDPS